MKPRVKVPTKNKKRCTTTNASAGRRSHVNGEAHGLNAKQRKFVEEYVLDLNATQACIRSGYSERTAAVIGTENLRKPNIARAIKEAQADLSARTHITQERVLQ